MKRILLAAAVGILATGWAHGGDVCANSASCCGKTCKVVCEMKKVTKTVWVVECEEFCPSLPGCPCGCNTCATGYNESKCQGGECASLRKPMVPPQCCGVKTKKKLVKKEIECEVPVYKCVVTGHGAGCARDCGEANGAASVKATAPVAPAPPATKAPLPPKAATGK